MRPVDAMWHWLSTKFDTDQFLVYAFAGAPPSLDAAIEEVLQRAADCRDFGLRIRRRNFDLRFPAWTAAPIGTEQVVVHSLEHPTWQRVLDELTGLMTRQLDPHEVAWRLHVFSGVSDVPHSCGPSTVVVLQITHALGDGTRTAALAGRLFGRATGPKPVVPHEGGHRVRRIVEAYRAQKQLARDTESGSVPAPRPPVPALSTNREPTGSSVLRTVACRPDELPGPTVLVGALIAVSEALSGHLRERGEDVSQLTADVAIAKAGKPRARNHFDTTAIGLYPDAVSNDERYQRIVGDLMDVRRRNAHPAFAAHDIGFDAIPSIVRRTGIWRLRADPESTTVGANTVVSSVDRGAADLSFGGCPVLLTSSYPSLMPMMGLTHGVHRIGQTVAVSVHTTQSVISDVDGYLDRLTHALHS
ncbi:DUF1298 domain-containing protein [Mycobacterium deserti]|uniref:DUF1298 domain-containing protein n=1 Tax=Mycobacterium deserti TaxID=2978347 RepID=A0ABT2MF66_9MYCO|nr:DUF1298 domain-containing protein [Mycobacterium deserti]MCT7660913.1 DUF1298 domain-containing protein [Mycobacterium deserti]